MALNRGAARILQALTVVVGIAVLAFLLWEPHLEGRNAHATVFQVYFHDPFLAFAYVGSIPFFVALYKTFEVLGYAGPSPQVAKALRTIRTCALVVIGFVAIGEVFIVLGDSDDHAGGVFMGVLVTLGALAVAAAATRFERSLRNAGAA
jgi:hypothetical protein